MKKTLMTMMLGLSISSMAFAFGGGHHRGHFDWDELDLTDSQEEQIDTIKDNFHAQFRDLRKADGERSEKRDDFVALRKQMMTDIQGVLTPEQQQEARALMVAKVEKRMTKRLKKLSWKLDLTDEQEETLKTQMQGKLAAAKARIEGGEMPTMKDRKTMMQDFDQQMQNILSQEQLAEWNELKEKRIQRMAKHEGGEKRWFQHH